MVQQPRRKRKKQPLLGSHQRCWLWGRHTVLETLRAGKWPVLELRLADRLPPAALAEARTLAAELNVPAFVESGDGLTRRCRTAEHQGYAAKMPPYPYDAPEEILRHASSRPLLVVLDSIQDPHNFGAILRSAEVLGLDGVLTGEQGQVEVTSLVARSSAGAVNHLRIARETDLGGALRRLRERGLTLVAASEKAARPLFACDFRRPAAVVIGNEGFGIREELLQLCDEQVTIPQSGRIGSLNAAVSAGILFYEALRQRTT